MIFIRTCICTVIFCAMVMACNTGNKKTLLNDTSTYDLEHPFIIKLPDALAEISGIVYYPKDTSLFAIEDEAGTFYKIYLDQNKPIEKWKFDKKHDYEDLALYDSVFYVLISNGDIEALRFNSDGTIASTTSYFPDASKKHNEFESLYYDDSLRQLVVMCKDCEDDGKKQISAWGFNPSSQAYTPSVRIIDVHPITEKLGAEKMKLRPSAAAINPVTNELYILSSINHLLIVADREGRFKTLYTLDPGIYKQAEGLTFTPEGDMIISNESHGTGLANILIIKNKKKGK